MSKSQTQGPPGIHGVRHWQKSETEADRPPRAVSADTPERRPRIKRVTIHTEPEDEGTRGLLDQLAASTSADELAHDLRTPLTPIRSAIWLMQRYEEGHPMDPRVREKRARLLSMMDRNVERLLHVVEALEEREKRGPRRDDDVAAPGVAAVHFGETEQAIA